MKFRKKPIIIDAVRVFADYHCLEDLPFSEASKFKVSRDEKGEFCLKIPTLEGEMTAKIGDWIIRGVAGEYYPCKPDIFEKTYEKVND